MSAERKKGSVAEFPLPVLIALFRFCALLKVIETHFQT